MNILDQLLGVYLLVLFQELKFKFNLVFNMKNELITPMGLVN